MLEVEFVTAMAWGAQPAKRAWVSCGKCGPRSWVYLDRGIEVCQRCGDQFCLQGSQKKGPAPRGDLRHWPELQGEVSGSATPGRHRTHTKETDPGELLRLAMASYGIGGEKASELRKAFEAAKGEPQADTSKTAAREVHDAGVAVAKALKRQRAAKAAATKAVQKAQFLSAELQKLMADLPAVRAEQQAADAEVAAATMRQHEVASPGVESEVAQLRRQLAAAQARNKEVLCRYEKVLLGGEREKEEEKALFQHEQEEQNMFEEEAARGAQAASPGAASAASAALVGPMEEDHDEAAKRKAATCEAAGQEAAQRPKQRRKEQQEEETPDDLAKQLGQLEGVLSQISGVAKQAEKAAEVLAGSQSLPSV